jgi:hypothetical protein
MSTTRHAPAHFTPRIRTTAGSVISDIGRATNVARLALEAMAIDPDGDRRATHVAELVLLALRARRWEEDGFILPAPLSFIARTYS